MNIFLASSLYCSQAESTSRPPASNASRWAVLLPQKIGTKFSIQKNTLMAFFLLLLLLIIIAVIGKMLYTYLRQEQEKVVKPKDKYDQAWDEFVDKKQSKTMLNMSTHSKKRIAFAVSGLFLFLIGYLIVFVFDFFAPWYKVSTTPDYIFSAKGGTRLSEESWISKPCDYSSPEFSLLTIPSENIVDCVQVHNFYDMWRDAYVRDIYGDVWMWSDGPFTRHFVLYYLVSNSLSFALLCIAILVVWNIGKWIISFFTRRSH